MSARTKKLERSRRFRRLHGEKKAVSPVVATLILILIAVAAAAALYLWLVAWQGGVTKGIGSPGAQYTVSIGGSTSVYPFAEQAATWFDDNNSDVVISVNQGGSGAGMAAVCSDQVDIGEASTFYGVGAQPAATPGAIQTSYGCPSTIAVEVIAYDGVDPIVSTSNNHGLQSLNWDTAQAIFTSVSTTASTSGSNIYALGSYHMNGVAAPIQPASQGAGYTWNDLPACAGAQALCATEDGVSVAATTGPGLPNSIAGPITETGTSTLTSVPADTCGVAGSGTVAGTSVFTITAYNTSKTFTFPTLTTGCTTTAQTITPPAALTTISAVQTTATTITVTWSGTYSWNAGAGGTATFAATATTATLTGPITQNVPAPVTVSAAATTLCAGPSAATKDICGTVTLPTAGTLNSAGSIQTVCGYAVCAGGANNAIKVNIRSDVSGTTQSFIARDLAIAPTSTTPANPLNLGFTGCGGDNQFDGCGFSISGTNVVASNGNPAVISSVAGSADAIGYASDGLSQAPGSGVVPVNFQGFGQTVVVSLQSEPTALKAIAKGISDHETNAASYVTDQAYVGWRPFINVETAPPTGEVLRYLQWVMDPANNQAVAAATYEISIYASGLAGVVPITPIPS